MLSDSPPERDLEWTESGVAGAWRFTQRLWRLVAEPNGAIAAKAAAMPAEWPDAALELRRALHKTIAALTQDLEQFHYNKAVARIHEFANLLEATKGDDAATAWARREALQTLLLHDGRAACELSRKQHDHACRRAPPVGCDERAVLDHARDETGRRILCWPVLSACQSPLPWLVPRLPPVRRQCARVVEKDAEVASVCGKPSAQRRELRWVRDVFEELQQRKRRRPTHLFLFRRFALCPARKSASDSAARL